MSTADAAKDMDRIRAALGEQKLSYFGFSYGTFLGTTYAGLFPQNVRALVLDGAIDPNITGDELSREQAIGFENALKAFLDDCASNPSCAFYNNGNPGAALDELMKQIDAKSIPSIAIPDSRLVGPGEAFTGVLEAMYSKQLWPVLAQGLALAQQGDGAVLLALSDSYNERDQSGQYSNLAAVNNAVNCLDYKSPMDVGAYTQQATELEKVSPHFGEAIAYLGLTCAFWPVHATRDPGIITAAGSPPILVVGTTGDPATPYVWAQNLAKELQNGVLLTRKGEGHTAYGDSTCIQNHVDQYLITLQTPPANTVCDP
jgi:pimeloyl-ACP methyl ester carboxylesterase